MANLFNKIIKSCIYLLVFLVPIFWLPFSFEAFEFNKLYLIFFLVSLAFFVWLTKMALIDKEIRFRKTPIDIFVLVFLFLAILSAIFSVDKISSLFGFYGRFSDGLIGLLSLGLLYFLITNNVTVKQGNNESLSHRSIDSLLKTFLWSSFFAILVSYFSIFGVWQKIGQIGQIGLPAVMTQRIFNPVSGSLEGLAVFLVIITVLLIGRYLTSHHEQGKLSIFFNYLLLIGSLGLLLIIDFTRAWLILLITLSLFLIFALVKRLFRENINRLLLPILIMILAAVLLTVDIPNFQLLKEPILSLPISWEVAAKSATENIKSGFLGSGIGTFHYDFSKFKPKEFNQSQFWQIRFDRAGSHLAEIFGTMGFLGLLSYLFLLGMFLLISWFLLREIKGIQLALGMAFLALLVSQLLYYQNTVLAFTFWLILGLSVSSWQKPVKEKTLSFKNFPELGLIFSTLLILFGLTILIFYFFAIKFYLADVNYLKSLTPVLAQEREKKLEKAISLNPYLANYRIVLARNYLTQILSEIQKPLEQQDSSKIQNWVANAISQAKKATEISPTNVAALETLAMIYRDIQLLAAGATDWAIKSFESAIKLEPTNPVLLTELGKLYLATDLSKAKEYFARARDLKPDYLDALFQEALIYERENDLDTAIRKMEDLITNEPFYIEARFQLGRLYFNKGRVDEAISQFETIVSIFPNHSNSLYSLGVVYTEKGEKEKAISAFEKVLELNPGNQDVIQKLEELKK